MEWGGQRKLENNWKVETQVCGPCLLLVAGNGILAGHVTLLGASRGFGDVRTVRETKNQGCEWEKWMSLSPILTASAAYWSPANSPFTLGHIDWEMPAQDQSQNSGCHGHTHQPFFLGPRDLPGFHSGSQHAALPSPPVLRPS